MQLVGFLILAGTIYLTTTTIEKNPKLRTFWTLIGCIMFFTGALCLIINSVGLKIGFLMWIKAMGVLGSFLVKLGLGVGGISVVLLAHHTPEAYDESVDGTKYQ